VEEEGVVVLTIMITDGGVATIGQWAGAPVANAHRVAGISAENPSKLPSVQIYHRKQREESETRNKNILGHVTAVVVADAVPYHIIAHF
jgi:hypothetical protein